MRLQPHETELIGKWISEAKAVRGDATCERIKWLTENHLKQIALSPQYGAWETLFQDPDDQRYWEQIFPQSEMHGGGPPALKCLSTEKAKAKYNIT